MSTYSRRMKDEKFKQKYDIHYAELVKSEEEINDILQQLSDEAQRLNMGYEETNPNVRGDDNAE